MNCLKNALAAIVTMLCLLAPLACSQQPAAEEQPMIALRPAFPNLPDMQRPTWMCQAPGDTGYWYLLQQIGNIWVFPNDAAAKQPDMFLDLKKTATKDGNEEGLLGMAFHPDYEKNGRFYVYYSAAKPRRTVLAEYRRAKDNPRRADPASGRVLLEVGQPTNRHNGGALLFGPDGMLYLSLGDGGGSADPHHTAQNRSSLLGKIIRIDVDARTGKLPYGIPEDNPFAKGPSDIRPEIWAYGLRNVWRMSFDPETKLLYGADVGELAYEEVNILEKGKNYGWSAREGMHKFRDEPTPPGDILTDPIWEHPRQESISITGGYVYRGKQLKDLAGAYIYADYIVGTLWALRYDTAQTKVTWQRTILRQPKNIISFVEDEHRELLVLCDDGRIYRILKP